MQHDDDFDSGSAMGASIWLVGAALMTVALLVVAALMGGAQGASR